MRRVFLGLLAGLVLFPATSRAQDSSVRACDLAAASPYDSARPSDIPGVIVEKIDPRVATQACKAALATAPEVPRLLYQMGRALQANQDDSQARAFYEKAAAHGHAGAQYNLANLYASGRGGPQSDEDALRLYKLAADQGLALAQFSLGTFYKSGRGGLQKSDEQAVGLFKLAADQGLAIAQVSLGAAYENGGGGLPKDETEAARLFKLAASQGYSLGQFKLAQYYEAGRGGLPKSDTEAARLYKLAADQGEPQALIRLASYYAMGRGGLQRNALEAERLCNLAADKDPTIANRVPHCVPVSGWSAVPRWTTEYATRIAEILERHQHYPAMAYLLREQGTVVIDFIIDRQGRLADSHVRQSSGWAALDDEALSILQRSQPFPAFPDNSSEQRISLSVPVRFDVRSCTLNPAQPGASRTACK